MALTRGAHLIGRWGTAGVGPTLIAVGGMHGNEPAGVLAIQAVLSRLDGTSPSPSGRFVGLRGSPEALAAGCRFVDVDLNRAFVPRALDHPVAGAEPEPREHEIARALASAIDHVVRDASGPVFLVDLHTTSSRSTPFVLFSDRLRNREFARRFELPMILGLEEIIEGALLDFVDSLGVVAVGIEGGQHDDPASVDNLETVLWAALDAAGIVDGALVIDLPERLDRLAALAAGSPRVFEVRYRHAIEFPASFRMVEGFANLDPIRKGQRIAFEAGVPLFAPESGRLLLPRYQALGTDGFFIAQAVSPRWLALSAILRRLRVDRLLPRLPGVRTDPDRPRGLVVDTRVARLYPLQILHLLGYRRLRLRGHEITAGPRDV